MLKQQHILLAEIIDGLERSQIAHAKLSEPPDPFDQSPGSVWLSYEIRADNRFEYVRGYWQAQIVSGLFADISPERRLPRLYGHSFAIIGPGGERTEDGASVIVRPFEGPTDGLGEASLRALIAESARDLGVTASIETAASLGHLMVEVTLTPADLATFLRDVWQTIWDVVGPINHGDGRPRGHTSRSATRSAALSCRAPTR